jgi:hypothetical protein
MKPTINSTNKSTMTSTEKTSKKSLAWNKKWLMVAAAFTCMHATQAQTVGAGGISLATPDIPGVVAAGTKIELI